LSFSVGVQLAVLLGEVALEDREAPDLLVAAEAAVGGRDGGLDLGAKLLGGEARRLLAVDGDERGDERPLVAHGECVGHEGRGLERPLDLLGGDVLAAGGDDDLLLAFDDRDETVRADLDEVAGAKPAVL